MCDALSRIKIKLEENNLRVKRKWLKKLKTTYEKCIKKMSKRKKSETQKQESLISLEIFQVNDLPTSCVQKFSNESISNVKMMTTVCS